MKDQNTLVPRSFKSNKVPGILFENKADYTTFFSVSVCVCIDLIYRFIVSPSSSPIFPTTDNVTEPERCNPYDPGEWRSAI